MSLMPKPRETDSFAYPIDPDGARQWLIATMAENRRSLDRINGKWPIAGGLHRDDGLRS